MMLLEEIVRIAAFMPVYGVGLGQGIRIVFRDGTANCQELGIRSFIGRLANSFAVNLKASRHRFGVLTGQKNLVPLVLAPLLLYVPLKTRIPLISGDPAYGYFRLRSIVAVSGHPPPCTIRLEGGVDITLNQSYRTVCGRLRLARKLEATLIEQHWMAMDALPYPLHVGWIRDIRSVQENAIGHGIVGGENKKEVECMELRNLMEDVVNQRIAEVLAAQDNDVCTCEHCRMDMAALALNELHPRYIVTERGETYSKADNLEVQRFVDVVAAVAKAVTVVQKNPRHSIIS